MLENHTHRGLFTRRDVPMNVPFVELYAQPNHPGQDYRNDPPWWMNLLPVIAYLLPTTPKPEVLGWSIEAKQLKLLIDRQTVVEAVEPTRQHYKSDNRQHWK